MSFLEILALTPGSFHAPEENPYIVPHLKGLIIGQKLWGVKTWNLFSIFKILDFLYLTGNASFLI